MSNFRFHNNINMAMQRGACRFQPHVILHSFKPFTTPNIIS